MAKEILSDDSSESDAGGAEVSNELTINAEFAKRFEYNKKREELAQLEEKFGQSTKKRKREDAEGESVSSDESSSSSEDEDEAGEFATEALDSEIMATISAIRSKDPRVYDGNATFYTEFNESQLPQKTKEEKPVYLRDYHRDNLLNGPSTEERPLSYNQQQEQLKKSVVDEMHAAASDEENESDSEDGFLVKKQKPPAVVVQPKLDIEGAEKDPETFLSNFLAARAWIPTEQSSFQPFESDDEEEDSRAEEFEAAYNLRFEHPEKWNEKLRSHARDVAAEYSVRREEKNARQRQRDAEKEKKEAKKQEREEYKARWKKLRLEEVEAKVKRIKKAAGLKSSDMRPEDWLRFIDDNWDDSKWEAEMQKRFNDAYYAEKDELSEGNGEDDKRRKPKKPKFDDDIDIKDIVPDFDEGDAAQFSLSDEESAKPRKNHKQVKEDKKREAKRERRILEQLVDDQLQLELTDSVPSVQKTKGFRYRETSPNSFGLTSRDILLADDSQLNQFVGLKKLAAFRDAERKQKDKRKLGKKARLRQWRKDTFGNEKGVEDADLQPAQTTKKVEEGIDDELGGVDIREGGRKKRRKRNKKQSAEELAV